MNIKSLLLASSAFFVGVAGANAADAIVYDEPAPTVDAAPAFSWTGAYIGGQIGYSWGRSELRDLRLRPDGFLGGLYAGYNFDVGDSVILGIDGDATYNDLDKGYSVYDPNLGGDIGSKSKLRWSGAVRARAGVALDRWMPYVAGGVAFGNVKNSLGIEHDIISARASRSKTLTGWTVGAGVDYAATDDIIVRLEYRYTDYGHKNFGYSDLDYGVRNKFKTHDIRLGVAYKF